MTITMTTLQRVQMEGLYLMREPKRLAEQMVAIDTLKCFRLTDEERAKVLKQSLDGQQVTIVPNADEMIAPKDVEFKEGEFQDFKVTLETARLSVADAERWAMGLFKQLPAPKGQAS